MPEAARKYEFTQDECHKWADKYHRAGVEALKTNNNDQEAKHQAEIRRLRAKIRQLARLMNESVRFYPTARRRLAVLVE